MVNATRPRVLYVDDNHDVADSAVELLCLLGMDARGCYDGPAAIALALVFDPDVCILDLNMAGMDGDQLIVLLRTPAPTRRILFVAITGRGCQVARARTTAAGFHLHLVKPVDPYEVIHVVNTWWAVLQAATRPPLAI